MKEGVWSLETLDSEDLTLKDSLVKLSDNIDDICALTKSICNLIEPHKALFYALGGSLVFNLKIGDMTDLVAIMGDRDIIKHNLASLAESIEQSENG